MDVSFTGLLTSIETIAKKELEKVRFGVTTALSGQRSS